MQNLGDFAAIGHDGFDAFGHNFVPILLIFGALVVALLGSTPADCCTEGGHAAHDFDLSPIPNHR